MNETFSAWRVGLPYYGTLLAAGFGVMIGLAPLGFWWVGLVPAGLGLFSLNFFRDPARNVPQTPGILVSPADGTIVGIEEIDKSPHFDGPCKRISIFLSVFNVHVNRSPYDGRTTQVLYQKGRYINAMSAESSQVNESNAIWLNTSDGPVTVRQISGAIARRIICLPRPGETLCRGQKIGMIKFGSRTELYLPLSAEVLVSLKQKVRGGASAVARFPGK